MKKIHPEPILLKKGAGTNALYWVDPPTKSHWSMITFSIADHKFSMFRLALIYIFTLLWTDTFLKVLIVLKKYIWREITIFGLWRHS